MKTPRDTDDLKTALYEQMNFLHTSGVLFDQGNTSEAKRIAATLRVLLHDTKYSISLLNQLNMKNEFIDSSYSLPKTFVSEGEENLFTDERRLFSCTLDERVYAPLFNKGPEGIKKLPFDKWWNMEVFKDSTGISFTRKSLVLSVANQDGGSHSDPKLDKEYFDLTRKNTHGYLVADQIKVNGVVKLVNSRSLPAPHLVIIREVAHEVLTTINALYDYTGIDCYPGHQIFGIQARTRPKK